MIFMQLKNRKTFGQMNFITEGFLLSYFKKHFLLKYPVCEFLSGTNALVPQ